MAFVGQPPTTLQRRVQGALFNRPDWDEASQDKAAADFLAWCEHRAKGIVERFDAYSDVKISLAAWNSLGKLIVDAIVEEAMMTPMERVEHIRQSTQRRVG